MCYSLVASGDYFDDKEWWCWLFDRLCRLKEEAQSVRKALDKGKPKEAVRAFAKLTRDMNSDYWSFWHFPEAGIIANNIALKPGVYFAHDSFRQQKPRNLSAYDFAGLDSLEYLLKKISTFCPRGAWPHEQYCTIDQTIKAVHLCEGIIYRVTTDIAIDKTVRFEVFKSRAYGRMIAFIEHAIETILKIPSVRRYSMKKGRNILFAYNNQGSQHKTEQTTSQSIQAPRVETCPEPDHVEAASPEVYAVPEITSEKVVDALETEENDTVDTGQDEEMAAVIAEFRHDAEATLKSIESVNKPLSIEKIAGKILAARSFSLDGQPVTKACKTNRDHFWHLLRTDYEPAGIRDIWNTVLTKDQRASLGSDKDVPFNTGSNTVRTAINRHRQKLAEHGVTT